MKPYTLAKYFKDALLPVVPEFSHDIVMRYKPFKHQIGDLNFLASFTRSGLLSEPGVGKTLPVQAYGLWLVGQGNKVIYVMPPVLVEQFRKSFAFNYQGYAEFASSGSLIGDPQTRADLMAKWGKRWPDLLIMSYRMFVMYHLQLKNLDYNCVVVDEATALKNPGSQLHKAVKVFAGNPYKDSNGVVLMTGTPVDTNVIDAYGLIAVLNPNRYGSKKQFERIHCIFARKDPDDQRSREQIVGYKNFDQLHVALFAQSRRVKKKDVSDLPPRLITEIPVTLGRAHRKLYDKLVNERIAEVGDAVLDMTEASAIYQALQRSLVSPESFTDDKFDNELLTTIDTLLETLEGKKVVMYCWYQSSIEKLRERYKHLNPATLYGKITGSRRDTEKMKFIENESCQLIIANPRSGGVGVDGFQDVSSHVIFAEVCPFVGVFQQSIDRLHRTGQKAGSVNVYVLVPTGTIAVKLRNDLLRKDSQQELVVRDKRMILSNLMGEGGMRGSLDKISTEIVQEDDQTLIDNYHE